MRIISFLLHALNKGYFSVLFCIILGDDFVCGVACGSCDQTDRETERGAEVGSVLFGFDALAALLFILAVVLYDTRTRQSR